jgi:hypothetical protein
MKIDEILVQLLQVVVIKDVEMSDESEEEDDPRTRVLKK